MKTLYQTKAPQPLYLRKNMKSVLICFFAFMSSMNNAFAMTDINEFCKEELSESIFSESSSSKIITKILTNEILAEQLIIEASEILALDLPAQDLWVGQRSPQYIQEFVEKGLGLFGPMAGDVDPRLAVMRVEYREYEISPSFYNKKLIRKFWTNICRNKL